MYQRKQYNVLLARMQEKRRFIQVVMGPRQVGKSTLTKQVLGTTSIPYVFYPADAVPATQQNWISDCWEAARAKMRTEGLKELILVIDEIQKILAELGNLISLSIGIKKKCPECGKEYEEEDGSFFQFLT